MTSSPLVDGASVTFELADPHGRLRVVRLAQEIGLPGPLDFGRAEREWRLQLPRPGVDRMEYLLDVEDHNGNRATIPDPDNPRRAAGAFGEKSVVEFPGYQPPSWLDTEPVRSTETPHAVHAGALGYDLRWTTWAPATLAAAQPAPLLVVHDGPEYAQLGGFTSYLGACIATGALPPLRAALLDPGDRNVWYAANPAYARTLAYAVRHAARMSTGTVGVGVSLGALAMLHAHRAYPDLFDALMLQSGSFFTPRLDPQEADFRGFGAVTRFVRTIHDATVDRRPVPTVITCGAAEENLSNNTAMAEQLRRLGYAVAQVTVRDAHNFTAWRDALDPHLTGLITRLVGTHAA